MVLWTFGLMEWLTEVQKSKRRPRRVVNQFKSLLYNHTATTRLRAGRLYCCEGGKKPSEPFFFLLPFLYMIPHDSLALTTLIIYLHQLPLTAS